MFWDFRVLRKKVFGTEVLEVHRIFYSDSEKSQITNIELQPYCVVGTDPASMLRDILDISAAFSKPSIKAEHVNIGGGDGPIT